MLAAALLLAATAALIPVSPAQAADERIELLVNSLRTERNPKYLKGVRDSLVRAGPAAVRPLCDLLTDEKAEVRYMAASVLVEIGDPRARDAMNSLLDDPDPKVRAAAIKAAGVLGSKTALQKLLAPIPENQSQSFRRSVRESVLQIGEGSAPVLTSMLEHRDPSVQAWALGCFAELGAAPTARLDALISSEDLQVRIACVDAAAAAGHAPLVRTALGDAHWAVRRHAVYAAGTMGDTESTSRLAVLSTGDPNRAVRREALFALARCGAGAPLLEAASSDDEEHRAPAVFALGMIKDAASSPVLLAALRDDSVRVRRNAAHALGKVGAASASAASPQTTGALVAALQDRDASVRSAARAALVSLEGDEVRRALALQMSQTESHHLARELCGALAGMGEAAEDVLFEVLASGPDNARGLAAEALGFMRSESAVPLLVELVKDESGGPVSHSAVIGLGMIGLPAARALVETLADERPLVAARSGEALQAMEGGEVTEVLIDALDAEGPAVRRGAAVALGLRGDPAAVPELIWTLDHDSGMGIRVEAARSLGALGNRLATAPLARATRGEDAALRCSAAEALGRIGDPAGATALRRLAGDEDRAVVAAAAAALEALEESRSER